MEVFTPQDDGAIRTRRLLLRAAQESDLEALHELFSDEDVMRYWYLTYFFRPMSSIAEIKKPPTGPVPLTPKKNKRQNTSTA